MAAVCLGTPAVEAPLATPVVAAVAVATEVKGTAEPELAPLKAGGSLEAVGLGAAVVFMGLRTLLIIENIMSAHLALCCARDGV